MQHIFVYAQDICNLDLKDLGIMLSEKNFRTKLLFKLKAALQNSWIAH